MSAGEDESVLQLAALGAVRTAIDQLHRVRDAEFLTGADKLRNVNGLVAGYSLGVASADLLNVGEMLEHVEEPLARAIQKAFEKFGYDIHVLEHAKHGSYAFEFGAKAGGQEATNRLHNASLWQQNGSHFCMLYDVLILSGDPFAIAPDVSVMEKALRLGMMSWEEDLIKNAVGELRSAL